MFQKPTEDQIKLIQARKERLEASLTEAQEKRGIWCDKDDEYMVTVVTHYQTSIAELTLLLALYEHLMG